MFVKDMNSLCSNNVYLKLIGLIVCIGCSFYYWKFVHSFDLAQVTPSDAWSESNKYDDATPAVLDDEDRRVRSVTQNGAPLVKPAVHDVTAEPTQPQVPNQKGKATETLAHPFVKHGYSQLEYNTTDNTSTGDESCNAVLHDGRFVNGTWQPFGCKLHIYSQANARTCFQKRAQILNKNNVLLFFGDSKVRAQFYRLITLVNGQFKTRKNHGNVTFVNKELRLKMIYYFTGLVDKRRCRHFENILSRTARGDGAPDLIFNGGALWLIVAHNGKNSSIPDYRHHLTNAVPLLNQLTDSSRVLWMLQENLEISRLGRDRKKIFNNYLMREFNKAAIDILTPTRVDIWKSLLKVRDALPHPTYDGVHLLGHVLQKDTQINIDKLVL